ncbi:hypothetical protein [Brevundimonas basaltis]|uniref:Uncharacterized protein n=1 Tax=Brevundimonas basaltis TaxID=472166 RepID=A0A7W8MHC4_9CAUL|nr:hypothetical protein [Brevundimonas basaltis]MBB5291856.1 hypothetical protein [Brevundimonas basaltis]
MTVADRRNRRWIRKRDFEQFCELMAERWFNRLADSDERHAYFSSAYSFYVQCGGRMGGNDRRQFDVFYGSRPVDQIVEPAPSEVGLPVSHVRLLVESGASLSYHRTERGTVLCMLAPARSEGFTPKETMLVLEHYRSPRSLQAPSVTAGHWRAMMSYFECTALDGDPQWTDHLRVWWLRFTRPLVIDGVAQTPEVLVGLRQIVVWSLTVGLSGAILFALQWLIGAPPTRH